MLANVPKADTIIASCGLESVEQTSWSTQRCHTFWGSYDELVTRADYDKFVHSFDANQPRSVQRSFNMDDQLQKVQ